MSEATTKTLKPRRVFGRVTFTHKEKVYRVELSKTGLTVRQKHCRKVEAMSFPGLMDAIAGQLTMKL